MARNAIVMERMGLKALANDFFLGLQSCKPAAKKRSGAVKRPSSEAVIASRKSARHQGLPPEDSATGGKQQSLSPPLGKPED